MGPQAATEHVRLKVRKCNYISANGSTESATKLITERVLLYCQKTGSDCGMYIKIRTWSASLILVTLPVLSEFVLRVFLNVLHICLIEAGIIPGHVLFLCLRTCLETVLAKTVLRQVLGRWRCRFSLCLRQKIVLQIQMQVLIYTLAPVNFFFFENFHD